MIIVARRRGPRIKWAVPGGGVGVQSVNKVVIMAAHITEPVGSWRGVDGKGDLALRPARGAAP